MPDGNLGTKYRRKNRHRVVWHAYDGGMYYVTICTKDKEHYLGEIVDGEMKLSEIGKCLQNQIVKTPEMRLDMNLEIPLFVIMPNHVHLIVIIGDNQYNSDDKSPMHCRLAMHCEPTEMSCDNVQPQLLNKFAPQSKNLASVIRGIKISTTTFARKNGKTFSWQSGFYDHIIRDSAEMNSIAEYIENNVANWELKMIENSQ